jgi:prevent-host-death family protein
LIAISDRFHDQMKVSVAGAKNKLPELIKAVENGEAVTICRCGVPAVDLVPRRRPAGKSESSER